jgi:hypothetical protein
MDWAKEIQQKLTCTALESLEPFGAKADNLRQLATTLLERTK